MLPPGLYEMILEEKKAEDVGADLLPGQYLVRLRRRVGGRNLNAMVVCFQYLADAHRLLAALRQGLEGFALELHPDKTRIIEFGRFAHEDRRARLAAHAGICAGAASNRPPYRDGCFFEGLETTRILADVAQRIIAPCWRSPRGCPVHIRALPSFMQISGGLVMPSS